MIIDDSPACPSPKNKKGKKKQRRTSQNMEQQLKKQTWEEIGNDEVLVIIMASGKQ